MRPPIDRRAAYFDIQARVESLSFAIRKQPAA